MTCAHYWLLDFPSGPTSRGVCKLCAETKVFINYVLADGNPGPEGSLLPSLSHLADTAKASARGKQAQMARKLTEKLCPICQQTYAAYRPNQQTCRMVDCRRAWNRMGDARRRGVMTK